MGTLLRAVVVLCLSLLLTGIALAQGKCELTNRSTMTALDPTAFFSLPTGSLAIGENCDQRGGTCAGYFDISDCQTVNYDLSGSGSPGRINLSVNPVAKCSENCDLLDSFLMAALSFPHGEAAMADPRFVDLRRNKSERWSRIGGGGLSQQNCCDRTTSPATFLQWHGQDLQNPDEFRRRTGMTWHSAFSLEGRGPVLTFDHRRLFVDALSACGDCSMKGYLLRFIEVSAGQAAVKPSTPLFFSAQVQRFDRVYMDVTAPYGEDVYKQTMVINLIR